MTKPKRLRASTDPGHGQQAEAIFEQIRAAGGRLTVPRQVLIETMLESGGHLTADRLAQAVQARHPSLNKSTVYRTMTVLEEMGVIDHVHLGHGRAIYHLAGSGHQHLVCESCESVVEIPVSELAPFADQLGRGYGFTPDTRHFAIVGLCRRCRPPGGTRST